MKKISLDPLKNYLPLWLKNFLSHMSVLERILLVILILLLFLSAILFVTGFIQRNTHVVAESGGTYTEASLGQPRYLNPILATANDLDVDISRLVYSSLFRLDDSLNVQPDLAESYEISSDKTEYTIHLRHDVSWHDGQSFTANDVVFTVRSIQTPDYGSPLISAFQGVDVEKLDDFTVRFKLKQPYAPFLASLTVGIAPQHVWENIAPKNAALAEQMLKPVGTGPFKFSELVTKRSTGEITGLQLLRNTNYYGQRPYINEIVFNFYPSHQEALQALLSGHADGVSFLPLQLLDKVEKKNSLTLHRLLLPQYFSLFFNQERSTTLRDANVRNALALATDRQAIISEALANEGEPLQIPLPGTPLNNQPSVAFDPTAAQKVLEDAGWKDIDGDGVREKDNQRLHLKITTTDWPEYVHTAEIIQKQWRNIGIETEIEHMGAGTIQQSVVRPREYDILLFGEILSVDPDLYPFWHSTQAKSPGLNLSLFKNKDIDTLLEKARQTLSREERLQTYTTFDQKFMELKPALILYRPHYLFVTKDSVHGVTIQHADLPAGRFNNIEQWHVRTRRIWN